MTINAYFLFVYFSSIISSSRVGLEQKKTNNSNDEAGKQTIGTKIQPFEIQTQLSNEGLQNGW